MEMDIYFPRGMEDANKVIVAVADIHWALFKQFLWSIHPIEVPGEPCDMVPSNRIFQRRTLKFE